jgi:hypothetical protein
VSDGGGKAQRACWQEAKTFIEAGLALIGEDAVLRRDLRQLRSLLEQIDARIGSGSVAVVEEV